MLESLSATVEVDVVTIVGSNRRKLDDDHRTTGDLWRWRTKDPTEDGARERC